MAYSPEIAKSKRSGQRKAALQIHASMGGGGYGLSPMTGPSDKSWRVEEKKRIEDEIKAHEKELANFDEKKAATRVRESLSLELERKRLRLKEHELEMRRK